MLPVPASGMPPLAPPISLRRIRVAFGPVIALDGVDLDLAPGSRHAVVGENGAGKSTLMKVLFGLLTPDGGEVVVNGTPRRLTSPADAISLGIGMVHQHFELIAPFTVAENVVLGAETVRGPLLDRKKAEEAVRALADESGLRIDPSARIEDLSVASQQRVEILKALYRRARVLILDEPTAVLAPSEAHDLWAATARLSETGTTVVFITHKLDEVMAHADRVTVLRRGQRILTKNIGETTPAELAAAMVGEDLTPLSSPGGDLPPTTHFMGTRPLPASRSGSLGEGESGNETVVSNVAPPVSIPLVTPVASPDSPLSQRGTSGRERAGYPRSGWREVRSLLTLTNLTVLGRRGEKAVDDVSLELHAGEILGLAGVDGSGQVELIEAIFGLRPVLSGRVTLEGQELAGLSVAGRRRAGIGYVPEDRHHRALVLPFSCEENAILGRQREEAFSGRLGLLKRGAIRAFLTDRATAYDVRGAAVGKPVRSLSGGNQQKLVLARELSRKPDVLLASQPTRGLDFGATRFVHDALRAERDRGVAVLVQSLDLAEVLALSDRVAVMLRGKIVAILPHAEATEARVGALMTGAAI